MCTVLSSLRTCACPVTRASGVTITIPTPPWCSQLQELEQAVERAAANPDKFQLGQQEISSRKDWIFKTRRQADGIMSTMKAGKKGGAGAAAAAAAASTSVIPQHLMSEQEKQQLMMRQQDSNLEDIEQAVARIGNIGKTIGNELDSQVRAAQLGLYCCCCL